MSKMYHEADANPELLKGKKIAVLGYGSQGLAHSMNLRDSGADVCVGLREGGASWKKAEADGWEPKTFANASKDADIVMVLVPDMAQKELYYTHIEPNLPEGALLLFAHGLNIHFDLITPRADLDVGMVAPKGPGHLVRTEFEKGAGVPCLIAVEKNPTGNAEQLALAYAHHIGGTRAGVLMTSFREETETDLFGEQAVLCGGVTELVKAGWETLVEAGYQPELAYFECLHELKLIVDLFYEGGLRRMQHFVSDTANYGAVTRGPRVVDASAKERMKEVLTEIQNGTFTKEWVNEHESGGKKFQDLLTANDNHPIEDVGETLRNHMGWLKKQPKMGADRQQTGN